ncbi:MAG: hypothetical protein CMG44_03450 [Candidatus Marinimicrobia bacterium]|nr:hypothetical protein [Candidatus Neomarinimicrobiota bacterium]
MIKKIFDLKIRPTLNNKLIITLLLISIQGCFSVSKRIIDNEEDIRAYPDLSQKKYCRGRGYVVSEGNMRGRLNFTFTSSKETSYLEFRDLIGRKTLFLTFSSKSIEAWDIRNNRRYDKESLFIIFPFFEIIKPDDLTSFLWGEIPEILKDPDNIINEEQLTNGEIQFSSSQTENGILINYISFNLIDENETINLRVENREFDLQYPHLIRKIPQSVMPIKESL